MIEKHIQAKCSKCCDFSANNRAQTRIAATSYRQDINYYEESTVNDGNTGKHGRPKPMKQSKRTKRTDRSIKNISDSIKPFIPFLPSPSPPGLERISL